MPDPKGEWSLKENNSELHYRIHSKVNQFIYTLVCNYMPNIRILAKAVLQLYVHKVVPIQNARVRKMGVTQPKIYGIGSKVNPFIYTLVNNYMPNNRILAKAVLQLFFFTRLFLYKMPVSEKGEQCNRNFTEYIQKLISSSTPWSITICQISGS